MTFRMWLALAAALFALVTVAQYFRSPDAASRHRMMVSIGVAVLVASGAYPMPALAELVVFAAGFALIWWSVSRRG